MIVCVICYRRKKEKKKKENCWCVSDVEKVGSGWNEEELIMASCQALISFLPPAEASSASTLLCQATNIVPYPTSISSLRVTCKL